VYIKILRDCISIMLFFIDRNYKIILHSEIFPLLVISKFIAVATKQRRPQLYDLREVGRDSYAYSMPCIDPTIIPLSLLDYGFLECDAVSFVRWVPKYVVSRTGRP
jgi:hypothetical protein